FCTPSASSTMPISKILPSGSRGQRSAASQYSCGVRPQYREAMRLPQPRSPAGAKSCTPGTWGYRAATTAAWASSTVLRWGNTRPYTPVSSACLITHWLRSRAFGGIRTIGTASGCRLPFSAILLRFSSTCREVRRVVKLKPLVFHFNDDRVVVGISNVGQVIQTAVRDRAGAENRLAVLEEVDDLVVAHLLSHVFPLPVSGLAAGLSLYPSLALL